MGKEAETKNSLQALQASEIRYRRLFETAQDGILILNAETGQIDDVNPYMIDMLHYSREEFLGKKLWEVSPFKDTVLNRAAFDELQDKGYIRYKDLPLETKEGKPIAVEFVSNVYKANGDKVIQCNIRNITERKLTGEALQTSHNELEQLVEERTLQLRTALSEVKTLKDRTERNQIIKILSETRWRSDPGPSPEYVKSEDT
jgi:PAS domain S-box-containing protein